MISVVGALGVALGLHVPQGVQSDPASERLYGVVTTSTGERVEGYLRWDRNETHWADFLDGRKAISYDHEREAERLDGDLRARRQRERSISLPNVRITWDEDDGVPPETTAAAIRFAHLRSLEVLNPRRARLTLTTGDSLELVAGSSDLGGGFRGLVVERAGVEDLELDWDEFSRVDFRSAPPGAASPTSTRLFGTLRMSDGLELTGFVAWDLDEALTSDILDGEQGGEDMRIPFGAVAAISRESDSSARVRFANGTDVVLDDSNDVDSSIRGIEITDVTFGRSVVGWDEFESLRFHASGDGSAGREAFSHAGKLRGTVASSDGRRATGLVRWDNAEEHGWEALHAMVEGVAITVELDRVLSIAKGTSGARVTLVDGRVLDVEVDDDEGGDFHAGNRGVFVQPDAGEVVMVPWRDLLTVTFER